MSKNENFVISLADWTQDLKALANVALLSGVSVRSLEGNSGAKLREKLLKEVVPTAFNLLKQELSKTSSFPSSAGNVSPIVDILKVNKAVFELFDQIGFMEELYQECPLRELVIVVLETHFQGKKPFILGFENLKKNIKISKMIQVDVTKDLIQDNFKELIHFLVYAKGFEGIREVARDLCKLSTPSSRSLVGPDLVNMFKVID